MTPLQQKAVNALLAEGFEISAQNHEIVRLAKGADKRIVMPNGTTKRAHHTHHQEAR